MYLFWKLKPVNLSLIFFNICMSKITILDAFREKSTRLYGNVLTVRFFREPGPDSARK